MKKLFKLEKQNPTMKKLSRLDTEGFEGFKAFNALGRRVEPDNDEGIGVIWTVTAGAA